MFDMLGKNGPFSTTFPAQAGDLSPICFDLPQFSHRSKNRHKKLLNVFRLRRLSYIVFCFAFACPAISCPHSTVLHFHVLHFQRPRSKGLTFAFSLLDKWLLFHRGRHAKFFFCSPRPTYELISIHTIYAGADSYLAGPRLHTFYGPLLLSLSSSPLPLPSFSFPFTSIPFSFLPLEVGPLNVNRRFGGAL